jgi:ribosome-binding factor A
MSEPSVRMRKVNEALKEVLGKAIAEDLKDPRVGFVTVTGVDATPDLRHAKVYVSVLGKRAEKQATLKGLRSALGYLQGVINAELHLKRTPTLEFLYDASIDEGMKIHVLLREHGSAMGLDFDADDVDTGAGGDATESEATGDPAPPEPGDVGPAEAER